MAEDEKQREKFSRFKSVKEKVGHRRVTDGVVTYKRQPTSELVVMIQHGLQCALGLQSNKQHDRDVLMQDFSTVEVLSCPHNGSDLTPAHSVGDFYFKVYAPLAFRKFRGTFGIQQADFLASLCSKTLHELDNAGASGSVFYLTDDDEFILKTVQKREAKFLQQLLPGYYLNLSQNPRTLLPKFYGLYRVKTLNKNIRIVVMNNILPRTVRINEKFDLKGSRCKRRASDRERAKQSPTWKDLDFDELYPKGIHLESDTHEALVKTLERDCLVLESFQIMDYSLLIGVQYVDSAAETRGRRADSNVTHASSSIPAANDTAEPPNSTHGEDDASSPYPAGARSHNGSFRGGTQSQSAMVKRLANYTTPSESIALVAAGSDEATGGYGDATSPSASPAPTGTGGIPAMNEKGERILLYLGIIDVLQNYRVTKQLEHAWKAIVYDGNDVSVHKPSFYKTRFLKYLRERVFLPLRERAITIKYTPSRKKSMPQVQVAAGSEQQLASVASNTAAVQTRVKRSSGTAGMTSSLAMTSSRPESTTTEQQAPLLSLLKSIEEREKESGQAKSESAAQLPHEKEARGRLRSSIRGSVPVQPEMRSVPTDSGTRLQTDSAAADQDRAATSRGSAVINLPASGIKNESSTDGDLSVAPTANERDRRSVLESTPL